MNPRSRGKAPQREPAPLIDRRSAADILPDMYATLHTTPIALIITRDILR